MPLIFVKRISDVFEDELKRLSDEFGDEKVAYDLAQKDHKLVRFLFLVLQHGLLIRGRIFQIDKLYLKGKVQGCVFAVMKGEDYLQNPDKQAKVHNLEKI
ncbi:MAG TPA: hypothetical protein ACFYD0_09690 [Candidatus Wunengus sp. YC65]|uniref:hypothetical protein n=1 Tax=Candidatus Wunengus sp. YC65 TaxID=3367701 RepID=UPI00402845FD